MTMHGFEEESGVGGEVFDDDILRNKEYGVQP